MPSTKNATWNLYIAGVGDLNAAQNVLANMISSWRDNGLKITDVQVVEGTLHHMAAPDITVGDNCFTLVAYGEGQAAKAYAQFPTFLSEFSNAGLQVIQSGIMEGSLRPDLVNV